MLKFEWWLLMEQFLLNCFKQNRLKGFQSDDSKK